MEFALRDHGYLAYPHRRHLDRIATKVEIDHEGRGEDKARRVVFFYKMKVEEAWKGDGKNRDEDPTEVPIAPPSNK